MKRRRRRFRPDSRPSNGNARRRGLGNAHIGKRKRRTIFATLFGALEPIRGRRAKIDENKRVASTRLRRENALKSSRRFFPIQRPHFITPSANVNGGRRVFLRTEAYLPQKNVLAARIVSVVTVAPTPERFRKKRKKGDVEAPPF
jgi:hypothetical protein